MKWIDTTTTMAKVGTKNRVSFWRLRKRYPDFPPPIRLTSSGPYRFDEDEVDDWMAARAAEREDCPNAHL